MAAQLSQFKTSSPNDTTALAQSFAELVRPGDVLLLEGDIGAGKTHFARSLIQFLQGAPEDVPSPTFTLIQTYDTRKGEILHADLYRLTQVEEVDELGLFDAFGVAICLVEWPDRLGPDRPETALTLTFAVGDQNEIRDITASGKAALWKSRLPEGACV